LAGASGIVPSDPAYCNSNNLWNHCHWSCVRGASYTAPSGCRRSKSFNSKCGRIARCRHGKLFAPKGISIRVESSLTISVKVPDFGTDVIRSILSREDERAEVLARRAQQGDYDEGTKATPLTAGTLLMNCGCRAHPGAIDPHRFLPQARRSL